MMTMIWIAAAAVAVGMWETQRRFPSYPQPAANPNMILNSLLPERLLQPIGIAVHIQNDWHDRAVRVVK
jgi:hypothetical protein